jgi:pimeloyl-ACP methyl ester carboxylesterase
MKPLVIAVGFLAAFIGGGLAAHIAAEMPRRIDVGDGSVLRVHVEGRRGPVVVLEMETDEKLRARLAKFARVVDYQRAGWGDSQLAGTKRDAEQIAKELHMMLAKASLPGPYILVGDTVGSLFVRRFAQKFPIEVKGLILIDPLIEETMPDEALTWLKSNRPEQYREFQSNFDEAATQVGPSVDWVRFVHASKRRKFEEILEKAQPAQRSAWTEIIKGRIQAEESSREIYSYITSYRGAERDEFIANADTFQQLREGGLLPPVPVRVITGMHVDATVKSGQESFEQAERQYAYEQQARLVSKHSNGRHLISVKAQRDVATSDPDLLVEVIREVAGAGAVAKR